MPEIPTDDEQTKNQEPTSSSDAGSAGRKSFRLTVVVLVLLGAVVLFLVYGRDHLPSTFLSASRSVSDSELGPLFSRVPANRLVSADRLLNAVGRSPVDPARVLSPELEKVAETDPEKKPVTGPIDSQEPLDRTEPPKPVPVVEQNKETPSTESPLKARSPAIPPTVQVRAPAPPEPAPLESNSKKTEPPKSKEASPEPAIVENQGPTPPVGRFEDRDKTAPLQEKRIKKKSPEDTGTISSRVATVDPLSTDQFQLPGSLMVKIHKYSGTVPKWRIMVILDDSASMARKLKGWNPNRMQAAVDIIEKLPGALERGSEVAIRDFLCANTDGKPSSRRTPCLSHTLYEWAAAPFKGMTERLAKNSPVGKTNPCAAAAYSMKKDFASSLGGDLSPRLLLVTDGAHRCAYKEVLRENAKKGGKGVLSVDVLGLGMHRKRQGGYAKLARRTHGVFMRIDSPSDIKSAMAKYAKLLKTPVKEKIEVRGEKSVITAIPGEELTIVPGTYTIVLPAVAGISSSKRAVGPFQIESGASTIVQVRVTKKGRVLTKVEPGPKTGKK